MKIQYDNNKFIIPQLTCNCDYHILPNTNVYIGEGIIDNACDYIKKTIKGTKCLLITDNNIYSLFGQQILGILRKEYEVSLCIPEDNGHLKPNQSAVGEILMDYDLDTDFLIALGSGTVNDITRYVARNVEKPFVSIGTAASMDGYVSVIAPMLKGNLKINKPAKYPEVGIYDINIIKTAPPEMVFAGFGDVIGKYIAKADWILGNLINDEHICPYCIDMVDSAIKLCEDNIDEIKNRTTKGVKSLLEALILTGIAMLVNTNSRPAASNEHNMGHYWEMQKLIRNESHPSHGEAVGVATLYCLDVYNEVLKLDESDIDIKEIEADKKTLEQRKKILLEKYGQKVGKSIVEDNKEEPISWDEQLKRINNFVDKKEEILNKLSFLPSKEYILDLYKKLNGPTTADDIGIDSALLKDALLYAKDYRSRYNVFKTAEELGVLAEIVDKVI